MMGIRFKTFAFLVFIFSAAHGQFTPAQSTTSPNPVPSLREFFQDLVKHYDPSLLPKQEDLLRVTDQIRSERPADIAAALPAIFTALAHPDIDVKLYAAAALYSITLRPDCVELLKDHIEQIDAMFDLSDERLQAVPALLYLNWKPTPPEVVPALVSFLRRTDRDLTAQASAVFTLVKLAPDRPEVVVAIEDFLSRPLDSKSRIAALHALTANPGVKDERLIGMVISSLDDPDHALRYTAIHALTRLGQNALSQGQPKLQKLAEDPAQPVDVRDAAKEALSAIRQGAHRNPAKD